jgi:outer membrane cobalamin receptor
MGQRYRIAVAVCGLIACQVLVAAPSWTGVSLAAYIESLGAAGLPVIYSDDLISDDLLVTIEPGGESPVDALRAVLRPHGMLLVAGASGNWLVVADPDARSAGTRASADERVASDTDVLPEIIVNSSVYSIRYQQPGSHTFLDRDFAADLPDVGEETLRALDRVPGVANGGVSTRSHVRGGANNEQLVLLDGLRLYEPYHLKDFQAFQSIINESAIDGIDFYTAGYQARYGDRMSGVIDIGLRSMPEETETELGLSLFNTSALSTGRFLADRGGDWLVSGRRSNLASVNRALKKDYGEPEFEDALAHLGWQWTDRSYVAANFLYSRDRILISQSDDSETATAAYRNNVAWLKVDFDWSDRVSVSTIVSATDISNSRDGQVDIPDTVAGTVADSRNFGTYGVKQNWLFEAGERWAFRAGFDVSFLDAAYNYTSSLSIFEPFDQIFDNEPFSTTSLRSRPEGEQYAGYVEARWKLSDDVVVDLGLRVDRQTYSVAETDEQVSPRLNILYRLGERTELRAGAGRFYQAQEINELQINDGLIDFFPPQHANHLVASLWHSFAGADLRIELYQKSYHDLVPRFENAFNTLVLLPELQIDRTRVDADSSLVRGAELSLSGELATDKSRWWVGYTWSRAEESVGPDEIRRSWDQTHAVKIGAISEWGQWRLSAAGSWHSGWPKSDLSLQPTLNPDGSSGWIATTSPRNSLNYDSFQTLDLRASQAFQLPNSELTAFIEVSNVLNRQNACCTDYSMQLAADGSPSLRVENEHWLPLVPSIGVVWKF